MQTSMHLPNWSCRWLALAAWFLPLVLFFFGWVLSWGYTPGAWVYWSLAAYPLGNATAGWLSRNGTPVPPDQLAFVRKTWIRLAWVQVAFTLLAWTLGDHGEGLLIALWIPMMLAYAIYPIAVSGWAMWLSLRNGRPRTV